MSKIIGKTSCKKCDEKYGYSTNDKIVVIYEKEDGSVDATCFACKTWYPGDPRVKEETNVAQDFDRGSQQETCSSIRDYRHGGTPGRGIGDVVVKLYDVRVSTASDGSPSGTYYPYTGSQGTSYKVREYPKKFKVIGGLNDVKLFGQDKFGGGGLRLIITEGEEDCLAVAEAHNKYNGKIYPVVSLPSASNLRPVAENVEWVKSFKEVVLYIDQDDAGKECVAKLAKIIGYDKIRIAKGKEKDASDEYLKNGFKSVMQAIWNASAYNPQGILGKDELWKQLSEYNLIESVPYPECFPGLNEKLKGMRPGEITLWTSGTGSGKSTMLREIVYGLLQDTPDKVGIISLEESPAETAKKLSAMHLDKNPANEEIPLEELKVGFDAVFGDDRVLVLDHAGSITEGIVDQLNYMAAVGCKYLFVDHITILVSEGADGLTGNEAMDKVMNDLLRVAKTHGVWIGLVSHLRKTGLMGKGFEDGKMPSLDDIRGSGSIKQISMDIVAFARDSGNDDAEVRKRIDMKVLKCRYTGLTGPAGACVYDYETGRLNTSVGMLENSFD